MGEYLLPWKMFNKEMGKDRVESIQDRQLNPENLTKLFADSFADGG